MLLVGEVRTCMLHNDTALPSDSVAELLALRPGERVAATERPVPRAVSPHLLTGVDCALPTGSGTKARGIGTVLSRAVVTAGLVLQGSSWLRVTEVDDDRRLAWEHYTERPGVVDVATRADVDDLAAGHLAAHSAFTSLDLGSLSERLLSTVQMRPQLNRMTVIRSRPLWVRWVVVPADHSGVRAAVQVDPRSQLRTVRLSVSADLVDHVLQLCEDFALHDWLLTTMGYQLELVERGEFGGRKPVDVLHAAIERLVHVWMPGAHVAPALRVFWDALDRRPGFSAQWRAQVDRARDQVALRSLRVLERLGHGDASW